MLKWDFLFSEFKCSFFNVGLLGYNAMWTYLPPSSALKIEVICSTETLVSTYKFKFGTTKILMNFNYFYIVQKCMLMLMLINCAGMNGRHYISPLLS
jgi:hypothetical protein